MKTHEVILLILTVIAVISGIIILIRLTPARLKYGRIGKPKFTFGFEKVQDTFLPTSLTGNEGNLYLTTKNGIFSIITQGKQTEIADFKKLYPDFLTDSEGGLLSAAFNPGNDKVYLTYTTKGSGDYKMNLVVGEFTLDGQTLAKGRTLLTVPNKENYHHAGTLEFGPHGYLYLSTGDGGPQQDPFNNSQNPKSLLGKILKIDVDTGEVKMIAMGLRNPWRFSITSDGWMFIGDVGDAKIEEIDLIKNLSPAKPYNFGWAYFEGSNRIRGDKKLSDFDPPIFEYANNGTTGQAVIGGYYLPNKLYVFSDYVGTVRGLEYNTSSGIWEQVGYTKWDNGKIYSMGMVGEIVYILGIKGIYKLKINKI